MIALALAGYVLGIVDAIQSVKLQGTGMYYENGLPAAHRKLAFGPHPSAWQLIGGAVLFCGLLLAVGELGLVRLPTPWNTVARGAEYGIWLAAEVWMVLRNWTLMKALRVGPDVADQGRL